MEAWSVGPFGGFVCMEEASKEDYFSLFFFFIFIYKTF
jgi:hypothetical protein